MAASFQIPDYSGASLLNLVAELEQRLTGGSPSPGLYRRLGRMIPEADTYVMFLADGLGARLLTHPAAPDLAAAMVAELDAPFPTTTTVSWSTIATGLAPSRHGLLGYQLYLPEVDGVVYTIKWTRPWGEAIDLDMDNFLPRPNLWERLAHAGIEPITVQPGNFSGSNLSRVLYRGCRFEPAYTISELVEATVQLAAVPGRLIMSYLPHVDVAAHVHGQATAEFAAAVRLVNGVWSELEQRLPPGAGLLGTADHGHVDYPKGAVARIPKAYERDLIFYGDSRAMFVKGDAAALADELPATWFPIEETVGWWGPGPKHPSFEERAPTGILLADDGRILLHKFTDERLIGRHGGLSEAERLIPLLIGRN